MSGTGICIPKRTAKNQSQISIRKKHGVGGSGSSEVQWLSSQAPVRLSSSVAAPQPPMQVSRSASQIF